MRKPLEPGHKAFQHHPGLVGKAWRGMSREGNRLLPDDNQFHLLQNMRLIGGQWQNRGGQEKANAAAMSGTAVTGIYTPDKDLNASGSGGSSARVLYQREPTLPTFSNYLGESFDGAERFRAFTATAITEINATNLRPLGVADAGSGDRLYYTDGPNLYESSQLSAGFTLPAAIAAIPTDSTHDGAGFHGNALAHGGDVLLFYNGVRTSDSSYGIIYAWDGATLTEEADTSTYITNGGSTTRTAQFGNCFFILGTDAYLCSYTATGGGEEGWTYTVKFFKRASGGGSWSTALTITQANFVTLGGVNNANFVQLSSGVVVSGKSYHLRTVGNEWYSFDGTTAVLEHTSTGYAVGRAAASILFDGYMYYNNYTSPGAVDYDLGRFDGSTWTDNYYDMSGSENGRIDSAVVIGSDLYLALGTGDSDEGIYYSAGTDTTSWTKVASEHVEGKMVTFP